MCHFAHAGSIGCAIRGVGTIRHPPAACDDRERCHPGWVSETVTDHENTGPGAEPDDRALLAEAVRSWTRIVAWVLTVGGLIAFIASFTLTVEKIELFKNPDYIPSCNFSPVLSCGSVMALSLIHI